MAKATVGSLESSFSKGHHESYWYERKYNLAIYKLSILKRSVAFLQIASELKVRLNGIEPNVLK